MSSCVFKHTALLVCSAHAAVTARLLCRPEEELSSSKLSMQPRICRPDLESPPALSSLSVSLLPPRLLCPLSSITRTRRPSRPLLFCCRLKRKGKEVTRGKEMTSFLPLEKKPPLSRPLSKNTASGRSYRITVDKLPLKSMAAAAAAMLE